MAFAVRPRPGVWEYIRVNVHSLVAEELKVPEYLHFKEELVDGRCVEFGSTLVSQQCLFCFCFLSSEVFGVIVVDCSLNGNFVLELDFEPFNASFPKPTLSKSIGNGVEFLNRHLSAKLFHDKESMHPLLEFLRVHCYKGKV